MPSIAQLEQAIRSMGPVTPIEMPGLEQFQHLQIKAAENETILPQLMPPPSAVAPGLSIGAGTSSVPSMSPGGALMPSPRGNSRKVRALYDFDAGSPGELSFKTGDELVIITDPGEGWLMAGKGGQQGLVPGNYVAPL